MSDFKMPELKIEYLKPEELIPYERNTRKHTQKDIDAIKAAILADGYGDPIGVWGEKNVIVEGHGRVMACKQALMYAGPVHYRDLQKHIRRMEAQIKQYDRFKAAAQRKVV